MNGDPSQLTAGSVRKVYERMEETIPAFRERLGHPLTLAEKILASHMTDPENGDWDPGITQLALKPDRVAMQDVTGQMALLQFMQAGLDRTVVPATVHCDHLIVARDGVERDLPDSLKVNEEVFTFIRTAAHRHGIGYWGPGAGIIHQVVLENYAFPGALILGSDSHTPNGGGLGMLAVGVGGADVAEVMAGLPWGVLHPRIVGVRLIGELSGWASPKDIIVRLCAMLTTRGGTNRIMEFFGEGTTILSATGKATICNMGAEHGATTSVFPYDDRMGDYLRGTGRGEVADLASTNCHHLTADQEVLEDPERYYDEVMTIDLSSLEPQITAPHSPDSGMGISSLAGVVAEQGWPSDISNCLIGSCTNSSYEDLSRVAHLARQALDAGLTPKAPLWINPGSEQIFATIQRDGILGTLEEAGFIVVSNACGPCIGQWDRSDVEKGQENVIVSSFNRNFPGRNDMSRATLSFLTSPDLVMALAYGGTLEFDPLTQPITRPDGTEFRFLPPQGTELPPDGFVLKREAYRAPPEDGGDIDVVIREGSERLAVLEPFPAWDGEDMLGLPILVKTRGKTTTDHISPAGPWLRFRGHLERLSDNLFLTAVNAFTGEEGHGTDILTGESGVQISQLAKRWKSRGVRSVVIGGDNYGEGSSREHAAMEPRLQGVVAVITRGFARIHETNLKKHGILPLTFIDPGDYDIIGETDRVSILGLSELAPGRNVTIRLEDERGDIREFQVAHSMTSVQIEWFRHGSAMNAQRASKGKDNEGGL